jgi:hypothetical protein
MGFNFICNVSEKLGENVAVTIGKGKTVKG